MSKGEIILYLCYVVGFLISYAMLRIEHESENKPYTKGDRIICFALSLFSLAMVALMLVSSWFKMIRITGYWDKPVKQSTK